MNRNQIIEKFIAGGTSGKASSLSIRKIENGAELMSYWTPIASRYDDSSVIRVNVKKYSQTTTRQQNALLGLLHRSGYREIATYGGEMSSEHCTYHQPIA